MKLGKIKNDPCVAMNPLVSLFCDSNVLDGRYERTHTYTHTHGTHRTTTVILAASMRAEG